MIILKMYKDPLKGGYIVQNTRHAIVPVFHYFPSCFMKESINKQLELPDRQLIIDEMVNEGFNKVIK